LDKSKENVSGFMHKLSIEENDEVRIMEEKSQMILWENLKKELKKMKVWKEKKNF